MSNLYQNLFETWEILAHEELVVLTGGEFDLLKTKDWDIYAECKSLHTSFFDEAETFDTLQGYTQRCIKERGWYFSLEELPDYAKADVRIDVGSQSNQFGSYDQNNSIVLLTAYLTALAAQRSPKPGQWKHFKGDTVEVVAVASPIDSGIPIGDAKGLYTLEDVPEQVVVLGSQGSFSTSYWDYKDRVFYHHKGMNWARKTENFLGLVGSEHPEHEGKLRFVEVPNAS